VFELVFPEFPLFPFTELVFPLFPFPELALALADISILILFLLFYDFCAFASIVFVTPTNGANFANGNLIGILPKKIINKTNANNNICPPIIKTKSDVEVSITHFSILTIFV
jgi:hypothetical protein